MTKNENLNFESARCKAILKVMKGDRERCLASGMDGYLAKPYSSAELENVVAGLLDCRVENRVEVDNIKSNSAAISLNRRTLTLFEAEMGGDISTLVEKFYAELPRQHNLINQALQKEDYAVVASEAHKIKSAAGMLGAEKLSQLARKLEKGGREQKWEIVIKIFPLLVAEIEVVRAMLGGQDARL